MPLSHMWLLSIQNMARTAEDVNFKLCFTLIHLNLNSHTWLVVTILFRVSWWCHEQEAHVWVLARPTLTTGNEKKKEVGGTMPDGGEVAAGDTKTMGSFLVCTAGWKLRPFTGKENTEGWPDPREQNTNSVLDMQVWVTHEEKSEEWSGAPRRLS